MPKTPVGQIDNGLGTVKCPKCGGENYRGSMMCGHPRCSQALPYEKKRSDDTYISGIDLTKLSPEDVERGVAAGDERQIKKAGFERYMDEINYMINRAPTEERKQQLEDIRKNQVAPMYNKYHGTNIRY